MLFARKKNEFYHTFLLALLKSWSQNQNVGVCNPNSELVRTLPLKCQTVGPPSGPDRMSGLIWV